MKRTSIKLSMLIMAFALLLLAHTKPALAQAQASVTTSFNIDEPLASSIVNPCNGETINFTGNQHYILTITTDPTGIISMKAHVNWQDVTGTGLVTGAVYRAQNVQNSFFDNIGPFPSSIDFERESTHVVGKGRKGANVKITQALQIKIDANGTPTIMKDGEPNVECK